MADVFKQEDISSLLKGKHILFIGDSNIRALYKDFLWMYKVNSLITLNFLKRRLECSFLGDKLIARSELTRGRDFTEHRIFENSDITLEFLFVTKCYCDSIVTMINEIKDGKKRCPNVILMNSCLWDVSRWGPSGVAEYKSNMEKLMKLLTSSLPKESLFIWATALPVASITYGGLIIQQIEFLQAILRVHVIEANSYTASLVASYGFDVLDFHYYMRYQIIRRSADGIHFLPAAMRFLTNLVLTHIALSWDVQLPGNLKVWRMSLSENVESAIAASTNREINQQLFRKIEMLADTINKSVSDAPNKNKKKRNKKKMQNIKVTHFLNKSEVGDTCNLQQERALMKTPPLYHKASPVSKRTVSDIQNNNFARRLDFGINNLPSSSNCLGQNLQIARQCNIGNAGYLAAPEKDFRLLAFDDFKPNINIQNLLEVSAALQKLCDLTVSAANIARYNDTMRNHGYSVYSSHNQVYHPPQLQSVVSVPYPIQLNCINPSYNSYIQSNRNHPYKPFHDNRVGWRGSEPYRNNNPGPMRQIRRNYNYQR